MWKVQRWGATLNNVYYASSAAVRLQFRRKCKTPICYLSTFDSSAISCAAGRTESNEQGLQTNRLEGTPTLYNSLTGLIEELPHPCKGPLKWYSCGPTVYDHAHIGHARTYVTLDTLRRALSTFWGYQVLLGVGVTDVDDKIISRAKEAGEEVAAFSRKWEIDFFNCMHSLGVLTPSAVVRVSEHVPDIISYIEKILSTGAAYRVKSGVYFDVSWLGDRYGRLKGGITTASGNFEGGGGFNTIKPEEGGNRVVDLDSDSPAEGGTCTGKKNPQDFALWKAAKPGEPSWPSPFGPGRPGWHIECSAMSHSLFGDTLDIHSGGIDLKFPHHTNEMAQSEAYSTAVGRDGGCVSCPPPPEWCRHWIHTGHLHIQGRKMSKSLKNFITVREMLNKGENRHGGGRCEPGRAADTFRIFCLQHKYRDPVTYHDQCMADAISAHDTIIRFLWLAEYTVREINSNPRAFKRWGHKERTLDKLVFSTANGIRESLANDFDTPRTLQLILRLSRAGMSYTEDATSYIVPEILLSAARLVSSTIDNLGLKCTATMARYAVGVEGENLALDNAVGMEQGSTGSLKVDSTTVLYCLAEFRTSIRNYAKELLASVRETGNKEQKQHAHRLLKICDELRDQAPDRFGLELEDTTEGKGFRWIPAKQQKPAPQQFIKKKVKVAHSTGHCNT